MPIDSISLSERWPDVIEALHTDGMRIYYLMRSGVLHPGRIWTASSTDQRYTVTIFLPFAEGKPEVVEVKDNRPDA